MSFTSKIYLQIARIKIEEIWVKLYKKGRGVRAYSKMGAQLTIHLPKSRFSKSVVSFLKAQKVGAQMPNLCESGYNAPERYISLSNKQFTPRPNGFK